MRTIARLLVAAAPLLLVACGGGNDMLPPPPAPPAAPPMVAPPAPTASAAPVAAEPAPQAPLLEIQKTALAAAPDALNAHDAKSVSAFYTDDAVISVAGLNDVMGREAIAANLQEWFDTFGKVKVGFRRVWIKNDVAMIEWVLNGTHSGELFGVKGNDQPVGHLGLSILSFQRDGHVKGEHRYGNLGTVMEQVGGKKNAKPIPALPTSAETLTASGTPDEDARVDVVKAIYAALEKKNEADFLARLSDDVEYEGRLATIKGKADAKKFFATLTKAFPDAKWEVTGGWGIGDYAILEYTLRGTHKGPILGIQPTGRKIAVHAVDVYKIKDGKAVSAQTYSNGLELMNTLSGYAVPPLAPASAPAAAAPAKAASAPAKK